MALECEGAGSVAVPTEGGGSKRRCFVLVHDGALGLLEGMTLEPGR